MAVSGEQKQTGFVERTAQALYRMRRRIATGAVIAAALVFGYHAIFGGNGLNVYEQRRAEDRTVQKKIGELQKENARLAQQVKALKLFEWNPGMLSETRVAAFHLKFGNPTIPRRRVRPGIERT